MNRAIASKANPADDELDLLDYIRVLIQHRRMILAVCMLAVVVTGLISYVLPASYVATASIVPPLQTTGRESGLGVGMLGGGGASLLRKVMDVSSAADMYVGILDSRAVTDSLIDQFDLIAAYEAEGSRYLARRRLKKRTMVKVGDEGIVYVAVEDRDPNRAAEIANAYVKLLDEQNKRLSAGQTTSKRIFLETRLADMEAKLSQSENIPRRAEQVQEMLYELLMRELEIAKMEEAKSMPTIQVLDPAVPPERRKAKGTIRKAMLAGVVAFVFAVFVAFAREYAAVYRLQEQTLRPQIADENVSRGREAKCDDRNRPITSVTKGHADRMDAKPVEPSQHA